MATLQNKTVVVVGGSSGIGFGVALASLQSQASVVVIASSNASRVAKAVERLQSHKLPGEVRGEVLDGKDPAAIKTLPLASAQSTILRGQAVTSGRACLVESHPPKKYIAVRTPNFISQTNHKQTLIKCSCLHCPILGSFYPRTER